MNPMERAIEKSAKGINEADRLAGQKARYRDSDDGYDALKDEAHEQGRPIPRRGLWGR